MVFLFCVLCHISSMPGKKGGKKGKKKPPVEFCARGTGEQSQASISTPRFDINV